MTTMRDTRPVTGSLARMRLDDMRTAVANDDEHADRMEKLFGYRPWPGFSSQRWPCPFWLVGLPCRFADWLNGVKGERCYCRQSGRYVRPDLLDHCRAWRALDGSKVITAEPYANVSGLSGPDLARFCLDMDALGISVNIGAVSPYFPTWTVLLTLTKKAS